MATPPRSRRLDELAVHDLATALSDRSIFVQPLGAMEAHGPHLPLATDLLIADHAAAELMRRCGERLDLWLLPSLAYTKSNEHAWAPGTVWLSAETMLSVLDDVGRSLAHTGAKKVVFLNAHGGNSALLQVVCRDLRLKYGFSTFLAQPFLSTDGGNEFGMTIHGGHDETSMLLAIRPDLVDVTKAVRAVPEHLARNRHVKWGGSVSFGWLSSDFEDAPQPGQLPIGVIGDGTRASAEHGAAVWEQVLANLEEAFDEIAAWNPTGR